MEANFNGFQDRFNVEQLFKILLNFGFSAIKFSLNRIELKSDQQKTDISFILHEINWQKTRKLSLNKKRVYITIVIYFTLIFWSHDSGISENCWGKSLIRNVWYGERAKL